MPFTTELKVGRLYEHRVLAISNVAEMDALIARGRAVLESSAQPVVGCIDYRHFGVMPSDVAKHFTEFLQKISPKVERSGVLVNPNDAIFTLQYRMLIDDTGTARRRRMFTDRAALEAWLGEVLNPAERQRMKQFLDERA